MALVVVFYVYATLVSRLVSFFEELLFGEKCKGEEGVLAVLFSVIVYGF